ncbi:MAG: iron-sulfur cluster loop [Treponema sp.]|nr:iron-sulfur cluster loop [Treponema sp.]
MILLDIAKKKFQEMNKQNIHFVENKEANDFLNNLDEYPHLFVLACLMDRQMKAERAWIIPYEVCTYFSVFSISELVTIKLEEYKKLFNEKSLHRFNNTMAECFFNAVQDINSKYTGNAANIWNNKPSSATVVYRFLEFSGAGIKIATMAANILARQYKIPFSDYYSIDISPDVHIIRVIKRTGLVKEHATSEMIIYKAREINPEFPGIIDYSCWEIGRTYCRPNNPDCVNCPIESECKKNIIII